MIRRLAVALLCGIVVLAGSDSVGAQDHYARVYGLGGSTTDSANSLRLASDGGFFVAGITDYYLTPAADHDPWVLRLDIWGCIDWQKSYPIVNVTEEFADVTEATPNEAIVVGCIDCGSSASDFWVLRLDVSGEPIWQKRYGGAGADRARAVIHTKPDGGFLVAGRTDSFGGGGDILLLKLDPSGGIEWRKQYGGGNIEDVPVLAQTDDDGDGIEDDGFVLVTWTSSFGAGGIDTWVIKLDSAGEVVWQRTYGGAQSDRAQAVKQTPDGGFVVAGWTNSFGNGGNDAWLLKLDPSPAGQIGWQRTYGSTGDDRALGVDLTWDGSYVIAGRTNAGMGQNDGWILKLDPAQPTGDTVAWSYLYGGSEDDLFNSVATAGHDFVAVGQSEYLAIPAGTPDLWVVRTDSDGTIDDACLTPFSPRIMSAFATAAVPPSFTVGEPSVTSSATLVASRDDHNVTREYQCKGKPTEVSPQFMVGSVIINPEKNRSLTAVNPTTMTWQDKEFNGSDWFNLYRGDLSGLPATDYGLCAQSTIPSNQAVDTTLPTAGHVLIYLVTGESAAGEGSMGSDSAGSLRPNTNPCP